MLRRRFPVLTNSGVLDRVAFVTRKPRFRDPGNIYHLMDRGDRRDTMFEDGDVEGDCPMA